MSNRLIENEAFPLDWEQMYTALSKKHHDLVQITKWDVLPALRCIVELLEEHDIKNGVYNELLQKLEKEVGNDQNPKD